MKPRIDPLLVAAFGSETRVRTLAVLSNAAAPLTAYRIAAVGGIPVVKAYEEVRRLAATGLIDRIGTGWVLRDADIGALLRRRAPISARPSRSTTSKLYGRFDRLPPPTFDGLGPVRYDVRRRREKDALLVRGGFRPGVTHEP
jgi:hypothetical protein